MIKKIFTALFIYVFSLSFQWAQAADAPFIIEKNRLPLINSLDPYLKSGAEKKQVKNEELIQFISIVQNNSKAVFAGNDPEFLFFKYDSKKLHRL